MEENKNARFGESGMSAIGGFGDDSALGGLGLGRIKNLFKTATAIMDRDQTIIEKSSNNKDFDYLFIRTPENIRFYAKVNDMLKGYYQQNEIKVFSEIVHNYDA